jgi:hypothetical protein
MKTIFKIFSICFFALILVQCGDRERGTKSLDGQNTMDEIDDVDLSETETYYVLSSSGLRMREEASLKSEKLNVVEYGEKVQVNPSAGSKEINVSGIKGRMAETYYKNDKGYMFTGYMSSIPVPEIGQSPADYARQLKRKEFNAKFDAKEIDDGMELEEVLSIPAQSLAEAFLIGQRLNIFEMDFDLPENADPKSLKVRANGKKLTLKLNNPTTVGAVEEPAQGGPDSDVYIEGYQFSVPTNAGDIYWMRLIDIKFDEQDELSEIMTQVAYEGGSWSCTLQQEGSFYVFRKNSIAD